MSEAKGTLSNRFKTVLLAVIIAVAAYFVVSNIKTFGNLLLVALGFGAVIIIHEFGHFITAKLSDIKVEAFSIGFPPVLLAIRKTEAGLHFCLLPKSAENKEEQKSDSPENADLEKNQVSRRTGLFSFTLGKGAITGEPRLSDKRGETEYRIGLLPFGGFVKMLGQDDTGPDEQTDNPRSFSNKPILTRIAVVSAGVIFNALSALVVFIIVFLIGIELTPPVIGSVLPDSPAARAGIRPGDRIIQINTNTNLDFSNIPIAAALSGRDEAVKLEIQHEDGLLENVSIAAELSTESGLRLFGIGRPATLTIEKVSKPEALLAATGLKPNDEIFAADGKEIQSSWQLEEIVRNHIKPTISLSANRLEPNTGQTRSLQTQVSLSAPASNRNFQTEYELAHICSIVPRLRIIEVLEPGPPSPVERLLALLKVPGCRSHHVPLPLKPGDIITAVGNVEFPNYTELRSVTTEYKDKTMSVSILRPDKAGSLETDIYKPLTVTVIPRRTPGSDRVRIGIIPVLDLKHPVVATTIAAKNGPEPLPIPRGARITHINGTEVASFYDLVEGIRRSSGQQINLRYQKDEQETGTVTLDVPAQDDYITVQSIFAEFVPFKELKELYKAAGAAHAIQLGYSKTLMFIAQAYTTVKGLLARLVSPKTLVGPLGILKLSYTIVAEQPLSYYFYFLGVISAIIAVMNFLPLPILDGGLVVLLLVEKLKGSPISVRTQTVLTYAGLAFIGALFLYLTRNDIINFFLN